MKKTLLSLMVILTTLGACSKKGASANTSNPPANLIVNTSVNADKSGNVSFTAAATNAVTYTYNFGNGEFQTVSSGIANYKYWATGTYTVNVVAQSADGQKVSTSIQVSVTVVLSLVWSDEFETAGLPNTAMWGYDTGEGGWGNNELENYTSRIENAVVANGVLKINAIRENFGGSAYTSARLLTKDKFSFKYGRIEVRAKLPAGTGTWPAIWMLGSNISSTPWPACGEMDIMEHRGSELNRIFGTLHHPGHSGANGNGATLTISNATTAFHNYIMEWSPSSIMFYVDTELYYAFTNTSILPFNQNFFIILNVAMGGNFAGPVDPAFTSASMEVDYVRVFQ